MSEDIVNIEVNGKQLEARKGSMLMEVTDAAGIYIPRFCYHKKLTVAANCRMCLVEVEKAPKPLPACATPVMEGMKAYTDSPKAIAAQKATMEFLLINHPLDCPICDQGGECELQDLAMGFGRGISRFTERKRVVKDKNIGPLIKTDMTRCIHCTRCVRFGEEIANLQELGATGRGEHMEIGTYIEKSLVSELSGNVIDLCPVGALTAKPSRYTGRSWEYVQHASISPHDGVGSNLYVHTYQGRVMRVVPRDNEAINETWIADRDRFSYAGLYSDDRLLQPRVDAKEVEWTEALETVHQRLLAIIETHGPDSVGMLVGPNLTLEEMYLAQKLARGLGVTNIDHRLRQSDFSDQENAPVYPGLGIGLADLEQLNAALLLGTNIRIEQPLAAHRLRKASMAGNLRVMAVNPRDFEFHFPVAEKVITDPAGMIAALAGVAKALAESTNTPVPAPLQALLDTTDVTKTHRAMAAQLKDNQRASVMLGSIAMAHPGFSWLRALAVFVAKTSASALSYLPESANSVGAWLAGVLPHRLAGGQKAPVTGLNAREMLESPRKAYILLGVEPEFDCWDSASALAAVEEAELVVSLSPYANAAAHAYSHVLLPIAANFAETAGSYVNMEGRCQTVQAAIKPPGEARPGWKVLRVLGNTFQLPDFDYTNTDTILDEVLQACASVEPQNILESSATIDAFAGQEGLWRVGETPIYATDALVRRAQPLQETVWAGPASAILHPATAEALGVKSGSRVTVQQQGNEVMLPLALDERLAQGCVWIPAGVAETTQLGQSIGSVTLRLVSE
jgi:NADH-quinone oxidoreductase subunit G